MQPHTSPFFRPLLVSSLIVLMTLLSFGACNPSPPTLPNTEYNGDGGLLTEQTNRQDTPPTTDANKPTEPPTQSDTTPVPDIRPPTPERPVTPEPPPTDTPTTPDQPRPQAGTCHSVLLCGHKTCQKPQTIPCLEQCAKTNNVTGAALQRWQTLRDCVVNRCTKVCPNGGNDCIEHCAAAYCGKEWVVCATDEQFGAQTCAQAAVCIDACGKGQYVCHADCVTKATKQAQTNYTTALQCEGLKNLQPLTPTQTYNCYRNNVACLCPQYNKEGAGSMVCEGYFKCTEACTSGKQCCIARCRHLASSEELKAADRANTCVEQKCSQCKGDSKCIEQCVATNCLDEYGSCVCPRAGKPGTGTLNCSAGLQCTQQCASNTCCNFGCYGKMSQTGLSRFISLTQCFTNKCKCTPGDNQCATTCISPGGACATEYTACQTP